MVRRIECPSTIGEVFVQADYGVQDVPGAKPAWDLQHKARNQHTTRMQDQSLLKDGFGVFYSQIAPSQKLADTAKRHLTQAGGQEEMWRPCYRPVQLPPREAKGFGKRFVDPPETRREGDVPRGKKHIAAPSDLLASEMAMFQTRRRVRNEDTGQARAEEMTDPTQITQWPLEGRKHLSHGSRNGVPQLSEGDKLYSHVQFSPDYIALSNPSRARLGLEKPVSRTAIANTWAIKDRKLQLQRDVSAVRALPDLGGADDDD